MKTYSVMYTVEVSHEAVFQAKNEKEARQKVSDVIGEPIKIESIVELNTKGLD